MASASYKEDLTCSICLTIFSDPVILPCGHSFCRECISLSLKSQRQCPQCRADVPEDEQCLLTNHTLKSLAEKEVEKLRRGHGDDKEIDDWLCPEHEERLKLFCVTDQQLACIICRDGEKHEGHKFKPIKEAAALVRNKLEAFVQCIADDIDATERLVNTQKEEITKTKDKVQQLTTQICRQFEEMHQFLRKREDEITNDLKHKEEEMSETLIAMETALSESRELQAKVATVLETTDSDKFLKSWTENNSMVTSEHSFKPKANEFKVENTSLSLGPYDSHLQFFMWKEMLQVIKPQAELLSLKSVSSNITVSEDGRNLMYRPVFTPNCKQRSFPYDSYGRNTSYIQYDHSCVEQTSVQCVSAFSSNEFTSGQHYWEMEVGERDYWKVGVENHYLSYDQQEYVTSIQDTVLALAGRPQKIGVYLDCLSQELSFYDAENMTHIHTMRHCMSVPVKAYFEYRFSEAANHNPPRVCWY
uniref:Tripartite motif-containing protein 35-like n=1 Tax=Scophthalmus maximus TaxID=52904 RepID=A0A8D3BJI6_SCOMX